MEHYKLTDDGITKHGHVLFLEDVTKDLNSKDKKIIKTEKAYLLGFSDSFSNSSTVWLMDKAGEIFCTSVGNIIKGKFANCVKDENYSQGNQGKSERNGIGGFESHKPDKLTHDVLCVDSEVDNG